MGRLMVIGVVDPKHEATSSFDQVRCTIRSGDVSKPHLVCTFLPLYLPSFLPCGFRCAVVRRTAVGPAVYTSIGIGIGSCAAASLSLLCSPRRFSWL